MAPADLDNNDPEPTGIVSEGFDGIGRQHRRSPVAPTSSAGGVGLRRPKHPTGSQKSSVNSPVAHGVQVADGASGRLGAG
jgi:hypothetical protein